MSENAKSSNSADACRALFEGQISALAVTFYQNERPLGGLAGILDWYCYGAISKCIQKGTITGRIGECIYFPFSRHGTVYHLILAGAGLSDAPGYRSSVSNETLEVLRKNLSSLKLPKVGISKSDFGQTQSEYFSKHLKGVSLWIAP